MNCIMCNGTGRCNFCNGNGLSFSGKGPGKCVKCHGTGKCNACKGSGSVGGHNKYNSPSHSNNSNNFGNSSFGSARSSYGRGGGFGDNFQEPRENPFDKARRIVGEGIEKLYSRNPAERMNGIELINSFEATHSRNLAYQPAKELYPQEISPEIKREFLKIIVAYGAKDTTNFQIFQEAANDPDDMIAYLGSSGLMSQDRGKSIAIPKIKEIFYRSQSSVFRRSIIQSIGQHGKEWADLLELITTNLGQGNWSDKRACSKAIKRLIKAGVNVSGFLVSQLERGNVEQRVSACAGLGELGKDAQGSVSVLAKALMQDESTAVRAKASWALLEMGKLAAPAEGALRKALEDESPAVSKYALKALGKMKKISKKEKEMIKEMEAHEKEIKQVQKQFGMKDKREPKERESEDGVSGKGQEADEEDQVKNRFFMSHSTKDFALVKKMADIIESWPGCKAWYCERDIFHGQDWMEAIYDGIEKCNWYILFWSQNAENSKWTVEEIREAKLRNIESNNTNPKVSIVNMGMPEMPRLLTRAQGSKVMNDGDIQEFLTRLKDQVEF